MFHKKIYLFAGLWNSTSHGVVLFNICSEGAPVPCPLFGSYNPMLWSMSHAKHLSSSYETSHWTSMMYRAGKNNSVNTQLGIWRTLELLNRQNMDKILRIWIPIPDPRSPPSHRFLFYFNFQQKCPHIVTGLLKTDVN